MKKLALNFVKEAMMFTSAYLVTLIAFPIGVIVLTIGVFDHFISGS